MSARPSAYTLTQPGRLQLFSTRELVNRPAPPWQVDKLIPEGSMVVLYGAPGSYKSFVAQDIVGSIAAGVSWQGRKTQVGHGLYVAAEGVGGMGKRMRHWCDVRKLNPARIDLSWMLESFPMQADSDEMAILLDRLVEIDTSPSVIVIDTLARCFVGDENTQSDMGAFIAGVDNLRRELRCSVIIVHHTRLDGDRERGNTALRGGADVMLKVVKADTNGRRAVLLSNDKQKDDADADTMKFALDVVGPADNSTLVLMPFELTAADRLLSALRMADIQPDSPMRFNEIVKVTGWHKQALIRALRVTIADGRIIEQNGRYALK